MFEFKGVSTHSQLISRFVSMIHTQNAPSRPKKGTEKVDRCFFSDLKSFINQIKKFLSQGFEVNSRRFIGGLFF